MDLSIKGSEDVFLSKCMELLYIRSLVSKIPSPPITPGLFNSHLTTCFAFKGLP